MKPETTQALRDILHTATVDYAGASSRQWRELGAMVEGNPTPPPPDKQGHTTIGLIEEEKRRIALRGVFAAVALDGREARVYSLGLAECFDQTNEHVSNARNLTIKQIFPELDLFKGMEVEQALEAQGVHFKARRIRSLVKPKA